MLVCGREFLHGAENVGAQVGAKFHSGARSGVDCPNHESHLHSGDSEHNEAVDPYNIVFAGKDAAINNGGVERGEPQTQEYLAKLEENNGGQ